MTGNDPGHRGQLPHLPEQNGSVSWFGCHENYVSITIEQPFVQFVNQSASATTVLWEFDALGHSTEGNPSFSYPAIVGGTYTVCLEAYSDAGCADTTCQLITVLDVLLVHVPNAFTPDADGVNCFVPLFNLTVTVSDYELLIFNRWGRCCRKVRSSVGPGVTPSTACT